MVYFSWGCVLAEQCNADGPCYYSCQPCQDEAQPRYLLDQPQYAQLGALANATLLMSYPEAMGVCLQHPSNPKSQYCHYSCPACQDVLFCNTVLLTLAQMPGDNTSTLVERCQAALAVAGTINSASSLAPNIIVLTFMLVLLLA